MTAASEKLSGYNLTEKEKTDLPELMAGYCRLVEEYDLIFYGQTEAEAVERLKKSNAGDEAVAIPRFCSPVRVTLSRRKGWRIPPNTVIVSRPSKFGNPFWKGHGCRMSAAWAYECAVMNAVRLDAMGIRRGGWQHFRWIARHLHELRGKNLACWCPADMPDSYCHAGKLLSLANVPGSEDREH